MIEILTMTKDEIQQIVEQAVSKLREKDSYLLTKDLSERSFSHKVGVYLENKFSDYNVDCEYNGYVLADNDKKYINILRDKIIELKKLRETDEDREILKRYVYPDIIVHKRGKDDNLLIIEIKKHNNPDIEFDREKLARYTSTEYENHLYYQLGALIIFKTGKGDMPYNIEWYEGGQKCAM